MTKNTVKVETMIDGLGSLHDAKVCRVLWYPERRQFEIDVEDIHIGSLESPNGDTPHPGVFIFSGVTTLDLAVNLCEEHIVIYDWTSAAGLGGQTLATLLFSPAGKISVEYANLSYADGGSPEKGTGLDS